MSTEAQQIIVHAAPEDDTLGDVCPTDSHWHYNMVRGRIGGLIDVRAALLLGLWLFNVFAWWTEKAIVTVTVLGIMMFLEMRRITPEIALRQFVAWLRGPLIPGIATRCHTWLGRRPCPATPRMVARTKGKTKTKSTRHDHR